MHRDRPAAAHGVHRSGRQDAPTNASSSGVHTTMTDATTPVPPPDRRARAPRRTARRRAVRGQAGDRRPGSHGRAGDDLPARPGPLPHRGCARPREDAHRVDAGRRSSAARSPASSSRPTSCPPTSSARACGVRRAKSSTSSGARSSRTSCSPTRSTVRPPRCSPRCSKSWPSATSRSPVRRKPLPKPFLVLATQNPIESEGVYALPEAQRDRFMMQIVVQQPSYDEEIEIARRMGVTPPQAKAVLTIEQLDRAAGRRRRDLRAPRGAATTPCASSWRRVTPRRGAFPNSRRTSRWAPARAPRSACSPAGRALALLRGRRYVIPQDVFDVAPEVLRHRLILTYDALADGITPDDVIRQVVVDRAARRTSRPARTSPRPLPDHAQCHWRRHRERATRRDRPPNRASLPSPARRPQLRRLELLVTRRLDGLLRGEFLGLQPGPGTELAARGSTKRATTRRRIDWNLTARSLTPQLRTTEADRELQTWVVVDRSASMNFGTARAREARGRVRGRRRVRVPHRPARQPVRRARRRRRRVVRLGPSSTRPALMATLSRLYDVPRRETRPAPKAPTSPATLRHARARAPASRPDHRDLRLPRRQRLGTRRSPGSRSATRCCACRSSTPASSTLPAVGMLTLVDTETGKRMHVQSNSAKLRERYADAAAQRHDTIARRHPRRRCSEHLVLSTDRDWLLDIVRFVAEPPHRAARRALAALERAPDPFRSVP